MSKKDEFGTMNIPDDQHFFSIVTRTSLFILTGRVNDIMRTYKSIDWTQIEDVFYDGNGRMDGGLKSVDQIQNDRSSTSIHCFRLRIRNHNSWYMCTDIEDQRDRFI